MIKKFEKRTKKKNKKKIETQPTRIDLRAANKKKKKEKTALITPDFILFYFLICLKSAAFSCRPDIRAPEERLELPQ